MFSVFFAANMFNILPETLAHILKMMRVVKRDVAVPNKQAVASKNKNTIAMNSIQ